MTSSTLPEALPVTVTGSGEPVTVAAHGLGASVAETRPLLSGVRGTRVLYAARGHGGAPLPDEPVTYAALARDLERVADARAATRALGVSMGAGALLSLLERRPKRFSRVVLFLPSALTERRSDAAVARLAALADALDARDAAAVRAWCVDDVPHDLRDHPTTRVWVAARVEHMLASPGVARAVRDLPSSAPVGDPARLRAVTAPVLVVGQEGDDLHPAATARAVAEALPAGELVVYDRPGALFRDRAGLRALISGFLA